VVSRPPGAGRSGDQVEVDGAGSQGAEDDREDPPAADEQPAAAGPSAAALLFTAMSANLAERAADLGALQAAGCDDGNWRGW
jgi:hypothetical protein